MYNISLKALWSILFFFFLLCLPVSAGAQESLTFGVHPFQPSTVLHKSFSPLTTYLGKEAGISIRIRVAKDYKEHIDNIGENRVDIAYMGPVSYVKMVANYGKKPLLARFEVKGSGTFQGVIIVGKESPIQSLADLKNKRFAFGDMNSTMSHLVPRHTLWKAGVDVKDLAYFAYLKNHNNVALAVLTENFDARRSKGSNL